ncbi:MAG: isopentenyl-diphosphate Delta-isomerase [Flavobacteriaceae bacterium]
MNEEKVILVDKEDFQLGLMPKMEAHRKGVLHRAFSVFIFNTSNSLLLQKRSKLKYHSPGLWTNTCCSHQRDGENTIEAAKRRLNEEMGFNVDIKEIFSFIYKANLKNDLIEHEFDHVLVGHTDLNPNINITEVEDWKWVDLSFLEQDLDRNPNIYTEWFKIIFKKVKRYILTS